MTKGEGTDEKDSKTNKKMKQKKKQNQGKTDVVYGYCR